MANEYAEFISEFLDRFTDFLKSRDGSAAILKCELKGAGMEFLQKELSAGGEQGRKLSIDEAEGVC